MSICPLAVFMLNVRRPKASNEPIETMSGTLATRWPAEGVRWGILNFSRTSPSSVSVTFCMPGLGNERLRRRSSCSMRINCTSSAAVAGFLRGSSVRLAMGAARPDRVRPSLRTTLPANAALDSAILNANHSPKAGGPIGEERTRRKFESCAVGTLSSAARIPCWPLSGGLRRTMLPALARGRLAPRLSGGNSTQASLPRVSGFEFVCEPGRR